MFYLINYKEKENDNFVYQADLFGDCRNIEFPTTYRDRDLDNFITNSINILTDCDGFIIPCMLGGDMVYSSYTGIRLGLHIRLTSDLTHRYKPIVFLSFDKLEEILSIQDEKTGYMLNIEGSYLENPLEYSAISDKINDNYYSNSLNNGNFKYQFLEYLHIQKPPRFKSNHLVANEWGAMRLAQIAKYTNFQVPRFLDKTLYFKYLLAQNDIEPITTYNSTVPTTKLQRNLKVAIIDDKIDVNANDTKGAGWEKCIKFILDKYFTDTNYECNITPFNDFDTAKDNSWKDDYDLIFLDLRLTENQTAQYDADIEKGFELLDIIKSETDGNPSNPVIIFTASKKAWNRKRAFNQGADGYYVKEAPELSIEPDFSENNFDSLLSEIQGCLNKNELLKPFWKWIKTFKENKTNSLLSTDMQERMIERYKMFYGLLKKSFEETTYNRKQFHYSYKELAFMTLWSCLNDIQYEYYNKVRDLGSRHQKDWKLKTNLKTKLKNKFNTTAFRFRNYFIKYGTSNRPDNELISSLDCETYRLVLLQSTNAPRSDREVRLQIIFILLNFKPIVNVNQISIFSQWVNSGQINGSLNKLNNKRNKLYLTHGDNRDSTFYNGLLRHRTDIDIKDDIKPLFEMIYFLIMGDIIQVDYD